MDDSKFLIIGAYGQLGKALQARFPKAHAVDRDGLDITNWEALQSFDWANVEVILNAAAYTNVDQAETAQGRAATWKINATAAGYLAKIATQHNITLVHVSTDYVFDGTISPHREDEPLTPLGVYAQSKAAGDIAISVAPKHYIFRISWLIGDGPNFVRTMINLAAKNISPTVVGDQVGRLTFTQTLVEAIEHVLGTRAAYGMYNLSNQGDSASWADITRAIFTELGRTDLAVTSTTTAQYYAGKPGIAPRPLQSTLSLDKIKATGLELRDWRDDLHTYIQTEQQTAKEAT